MKRDHVTAVMKLIFNWLSFGMQSDVFINVESEWERNTNVNICTVASCEVHSSFSQIYVGN